MVFENPNTKLIIVFPSKRGPCKEFLCPGGPGGSGSGTFNPRPFLSAMATQAKLKAKGNRKAAAKAQQRAAKIAKNNYAWPSFRVQHLLFVSGMVRSLSKHRVWGGSKTI